MNPLERKLVKHFTRLEMASIEKIVERNSARVPCDKISRRTSHGSNGLARLRQSASPREVLESIRTWDVLAVMMSTPFLTIISPII